jgi:hypothetical protein
MNAADYGASLIRTWVPYIVGGVLGWLATRGLGVSPADAIGVTSGLTVAIGGVYYSAIRLLETRFPALGIFLGKPSAPTYRPTPPDTASTGRAAQRRPGV